MNKQIACLIIFISSTVLMSTVSAFNTNLRTSQEEDYGNGLTSEELNFIRIRVIEVAKTEGAQPQHNAQALAQILNKTFGGIWGVFILGVPSAKDSFAGIEVNPVY